MDFKYYERKINDIIIKCPIEAGVEILVYNVLDDIVESKGLSLVDINRIWKNRDERLTTKAGISDIAVLSKDFEFGDMNKGKVFGLVEVKATNRVLKETEQVEGHKESSGHYIFTNGLVWKIYNKNGNDTIYLTKSKIDSVNSARTVIIDEDSFIGLIDKLKSIDWKN